MASPPPVSEFPSLLLYDYSSTDISKQFPIHNPATGALITTIQGGSAQTAEDALARSQEAFLTWREKTPTQRAELLLQCSSAIKAHSEELAALLCLENGKPYTDALLGDIAFAVNIFRYYASLVDKVPTELHDYGSVYALHVREPLGVVAAILPFNWPPIHCCGKTAPALAMGNTIVIKPGEQAPLTAIRIISILQTVLPKDVVQFVPGFGPEVPQALVESKVVKKISFTGSTNAGRLVAEKAGKGLKSTLLELGGKNALVVFEDVNVQEVVKAALEGAMFNKGETCTASSRLIIHKNVYAEFVQRLGRAIEKLKVGDGMKPDTHVAACVSKAQQERVKEYIRIGVEDDGATIAAQAQLPSDPAYKDGFFVKPTLFTSVKRHMRIAKEEIFGPVVVAIEFETEAEALSIVNESEYGLIAGVFTKNTERGLRVARQIDVGVVFLNNYHRSIIGSPFGGVKDSGYGREHCIETLKEYSTSKVIRMPSGTGMIPRWRAVSDIFGEDNQAVSGSVLT